jgi:hypothetical protein
MQRIFSSEGPWATPWMERVLPVVTELAARNPEQTVFTRFITLKRAEDMPGMWQRYYTRWQDATRERLDPALLELLPPLASLCRAPYLISSSFCWYNRRVAASPADFFPPRLRDATKMP